MVLTTIDRLIINAPYEGPAQHWRYERETRTFVLAKGRRPAGYGVAAGDSNMRNPVLASFAAKLLPYRGLGSGLLRAFSAWPDIELTDDKQRNLFKATVRRAPASLPHSAPPGEGA